MAASDDIDEIGSDHRGPVRASIVIPLATAIASMPLAQRPLVSRAVAFAGAVAVFGAAVAASRGRSGRHPGPAGLAGRRRSESRWSPMSSARCWW
jgi:hypothetical protein